MVYSMHNKVKQLHILRSILLNAITITKINCHYQDTHQNFFCWNCHSRFQGKILGYWVCTCLPGHTFFMEDNSFYSKRGFIVYIKSFLVYVSPQMRCYIYTYVVYKVYLQLFCDFKFIFLKSQLLMFKMTIFTPF